MLLYIFDLDSTIISPWWETSDFDLDRCVPFSHIKDLLAYITNSNAKIALVSNLPSDTSEEAARERFKKILKRFELPADTYCDWAKVGPGYYTTRLAQVPDKAMPNASMLLSAIENSGASRASTFFVCDAQIHQPAAKAADIKLFTYTDVYTRNIPI